MGDTKTTYIMPDQGFGNSNDVLTASLLSNGGGFGNGMWNNPFIYLIWMYMMRWMNGNGDGEASTQRQIQTLADQMNDNHTSDLIMAAIKDAQNQVAQISKDALGPMGGAF